MTDLFAGGEPLPIPLEAQITAVEREISMRLQVYGRRVDAGQMRREKAHAEIAAMRAVLRTLKGIHEAPKVDAAANRLSVDYFAAIARLDEVTAYAVKLEALLKPFAEIHIPGDPGIDASDYPNVKIAVPVADVKAIRAALSIPLASPNSDPPGQAGHPQGNSEGQPPQPGGKGYVLSVSEQEIMRHALMRSVAVVNPAPDAAACPTAINSGSGVATTSPLGVFNAWPRECVQPNDTAIRNGVPDSACECCQRWFLALARFRGDPSVPPASAVHSQGNPA